MYVCPQKGVLLSRILTILLATLKLTPIRNANVPPPMALHELQLQQNAVDVAIGQSSTCFIVLDLAGITAYNYRITSKSTKQPTIIERYQLPEECGTPVQVSLRGDDEIYLLTHLADANRDEVYFSRFEDGSWTKLSIDMDHVASIFANQSYDQINAQNSHGLTSSISDNVVQGWSIKFPGTCPWTELVQVADEVRLTFNISLKIITNETSKFVSVFHQLGPYTLTLSCLLRTARRF
jgi:elongator complex protein 1